MVTIIRNAKRENTGNIPAILEKPEGNKEVTFIRDADHGTHTEKSSSRPGSRTRRSFTPSAIPSLPRLTETCL
jgi:hypothetical protein